MTLLLVVVGPLWLPRPRRDPLCGAALCMAVSAMIGVLASYYGDTTERKRHCYGPSLVLALFLALLAWLDRARWPGVRTRRARAWRSGGREHAGDHRSSRAG